MTFEADDDNEAGAFFRGMAWAVCFTAVGCAILWFLW